MISFTVTPSYGDYVAANRLARRKAWAPTKIVKPALTFFVFTALASLLLTTGAGVPWREHLPASLAAGVVGAAIWLLVCFGLGTLRFGGLVRKAYDQTGTISLPTTYSFNDDGMEAEYEEGSSRHGWSRFTEYLLDSHVLMLRRSDLMFFLIPREQVRPEQLDQLTALLARAGVKRG